MARMRFTSAMAFCTSSAQNSSSGSSFKASLHIFTCSRADFKSNLACIWVFNKSCFTSGFVWFFATFSIAPTNLAWSVRALYLSSAVGGGGERDGDETRFFELEEDDEDPLRFLVLTEGERRESAKSTTPSKTQI